MYQVQIQNYNSEWEAAGKPTPSFPQANAEAHELRELLDAEVRVACVDSTVSE